MKYTIDNHEHIFTKEKPDNCDLCGLLKTTIEEKVKKTMGNIFDSILERSKAEALKNYPKLIEQLKDIGETTPDNFHILFYYPISECIEAILSQKITDKKNASVVAFIYENFNFVENNLLSFITQKEGTACSADKSGWLVNRLVKFYSKGEKLDMTIDDKCFWKPHFWKHEQWVALFEALVDLYYGDFKKYMLFLKENWVPFIKEAQERSKE